MAKNTSIGVDIGSSSLKVVLLKRTSNGVRLDKFIIEDYNLSHKELESPEVRHKKITEILQRIFKDLKPQNVVFSVAKGEDNIRIITMPLVAEKALRESLKWGGQPDYIPFDLKEMIWDVNISQVLRRKEEIKSDGKEKMDVVLALAKKPVVDLYLDLSEKMKYSMDILESNVLAGVNFTCFNLTLAKDKIWCKIDIGAEATAVNILEGENLKFSLNIPWGVNDIIEMVESVLGKNWQEAKEYAKKVNFGADALADIDSKNVFQAMEPKIKDFSRQLNGAFSFFESRNPGKIISEILISGGGSKLAGLDKYIMERTGKLVKVENVINKNLINFSKNDEEKITSSLPFLNVAIGAALRNLANVKNNINLLPLDVMIGRKLSTRRLSVLVFVGFFFLCLIGVSIYKYIERGNVIGQIEKIDKDLSGMSIETTELAKMNATINAFKETEREYFSIKKQLPVWSNIVHELVRIIPDKTWLNSAAWSASGFSARGKCPKKIDQVNILVENGNSSLNEMYKNMLPDVRTSFEEIEFNVGKRAEKKKGTK